MSTSSDEKNDNQFPTLSLKKQSSLVQTKNNHLNCMDSDCLYHLGLCKEDAEYFSQVKYVCIGGTNDRMVKFAKQVAKTLQLPESEVKSVGIHKRYVIYLVGPVLVCSHGMGGPSISILLNEIAKLLKYANADACWIRMGTCGGIDVVPGTVVVSSQSLNGALEPFHETIVLGKRVKRPAVFDQQLTESLIGKAKEMNLDCAVGKTMCCDDFYEGQGRLDGAICEYNETDKFEFLEKAKQEGVRNIEMESLQFGAFTGMIGVRSAVICVALLNRLDGDQVTSTMEELGQFEERPMKTVLSFIKGTYFGGCDISMKETFNLKSIEVVS